MAVVVGMEMEAVVMVLVAMMVVGIVIGGDCDNNI
jgi:hypothetical protein